MCRPYERAGQFPVGTLIRPLRGRLSLPPLAFGHFPLTGGRLTDDRKSRPYKNTKACPVNAVGAGPRPARRLTDCVPNYGGGGKPPPYGILLTMLAP